MTGASLDVVALYPQLENLAAKVCRSAVVPAHLRGKPDELFAVFALGAELGLAPMETTRLVDFLNGKAVLNSEGKRRLIVGAGHSLRTVDRSEERATVAGRRRGEDEWVEVTYTIEDARRAGLAGKDNWKKHPKEMLVARAYAILAREHFPDAIGGQAWDADELDDDHLGAEVAPVAQATVDGYVVSEKAANALISLCRSLGLDDHDVMRSLTDGASDDVTTLTTDLVVAFRDTAKRLSMEKPAEEVVVEDAVVVEPGAERDKHRDMTLTDAQLRRIHAMFGDLKIEDREERIAHAEAAVGHPLESSKNLTRGEASVVIDALKRFGEGGVELLVGDGGAWTYREVVPS